MDFILIAWMKPLINMMSGYLLIKIGYKNTHMIFNKTILPIMQRTSYHREII